MLLLFLALLRLSDAERDSNPYPFGNNPNSQFKMYWKDSSNVLQDIDEFQALYIKYHGCVWSECVVDNYDDDGENHDGDENWYMTRSTGTCANAAYSLYGIPKGRLSILNSCSKGTYINSFFTYGGADTLATALGKSISTTVDDDSYTNAYCSNYYNGNNNNNHRELNSNDNNNNGGYTSTMGCSTDGSFVTAVFSGDACQGDTFVEQVDSRQDYNRVFNRMNCVSIWGRGSDDVNDITSSAAYALLQNSWACDMDVYPDECPDPYGKKRLYTKILRSAANGSPVRWTALATRFQLPLRLVSWLFFLGGMGLLCLSFYRANKEAIQQNGGGFKGVVTVLRKKLQERRQALRRKRKRKKKKRDAVDPDEDVPNKNSRRKRGEMA